MEIERTMDYDVTPDEVRRMACLPEFQERKCEDAGATSWKVTVTDESSGDTTVKTRRTMPADGMPSLLRKLMADGMTSTETVVWAAAAEPDGSRRATLELSFHGAPAGMHGTIHVTPTAAGGSHVQIHATFKAHVPLVGRKVEQLAAPIIIEAIDSEQRTGRAWAEEAA